MNKESVARTTSSSGKKDKQDNATEHPGVFYVKLKLYGLRTFSLTAIFVIVGAIGVGCIALPNSTVMTNNLICCGIGLVGFLAGALCAFIESRSFEKVILKVDKKLVSRSASGSRTIRYFLKTELGISWVTEFVYKSVTENETFEFGVTKRTWIFRILYWGDVDLWGPANKVG